jgi:nitrite reductase (NO-forming)
MYVIRFQPRQAIARLLALALLAATLTTGCLPNKEEATAATAPESEAVERTFTMEARITGYVGVGGDIDGEKNPTLDVNKGDEVTIQIINKENMAHDIALDSNPDEFKSKATMKVGETAELTFTATANDTYFCSIPGHRQAGMLGKIVVSGGEDEKVVAQKTEADPHMAHMAGSGDMLKDARPVSVEEIGWDASDIPPPIDRNYEDTVEFTIETEEVIAELEDGTTYEMWTYDGKVPGPMLRVREGDTVIVNVDNAEDSTMAHSIDFHAVTGPGGGAAALQVPPGERRTLKFKAMKAGLFVYHCATPHIATHLARGMYGMILVEPRDGLPEVDREYYVMQGEYYTTARPGTKGHQMEDADRLFEEQPTYVVMNGRVGSLTGERAMKAEVGETVRMFFGVGGPNTRSSFHVIGEIFDRVYHEAAIIDPPFHNVQTTLVPPGGATMVEFQVDYPGSYLAVDHSLTRLDKGAVGILEVTGEKNPEIYEALK